MASGRILVIIATPEVLGSCDGGSWAAGFGAADRQAGGVRRLIAAGVSSLQACRMVGINPRTGKRWRHGRTITSSGGRRLHYPPVINSPVREVSPRFLSEDERVAIADLHGAAGAHARSPGRLAGIRPRSAGSCAATSTRPAGSTGRSPRSAWRPPVGLGLGAASWRAMPSWPGSCRSSCGGGGAGADLPCAARAVPDQPSRHLVPETIYQALYRPGSTLRRELPPRCCAPGAPGAARAGTRTRAAAGW